jgi:hypothetical protein
MVTMTALQNSAVDVGLARGTRCHESFEIVDEFQFCGREAGPVNRVVRWPEIELRFVARGFAGAGDGRLMMVVDRRRWRGIDGEMALGPDRFLP